MIITLKGANFSTNNIGTLSTWTISRVLGSGATYSGATYVDKDAALNATVTIGEGYELGSAGVTVTMGGSPVTSGITTSGNTITISISSVTGNVVVKVPTKNITTGEEGGSDDGDGNDTTPTIRLVSETGAILTENSALSETASTPESRSGYYTYEYIPVTSNTTYKLEYGRRLWQFDSQKVAVGTSAAIHNITPKYEFTTRENVAFVSITVKTDDIAPANLKIETIG